MRLEALKQIAIDHGFKLFTILDKNENKISRYPVDQSKDSEELKDLSTEKLNNFLSKIGTQLPQGNYKIEFRVKPTAPDSFTYPLIITNTAANGSVDVKQFQQIDENALRERIISEINAEREKEEYLRAKKEFEREKEEFKNTWGAKAELLVGALISSLFKNNPQLATLGNSLMSKPTTPTTEVLADPETVYSKEDYQKINEAMNILAKIFDPNELLAVATRLSTDAGTLQFVKSYIKS